MEHSESTFEYGTDIESYIERLSEYNTTCYFHNLKFDGVFIIDWLLKNGYAHSAERKVLPGEFSSLISDMGQYYSITVRWENGRNTEFRDSYKKLPMPVSKIAKSFNMDEGKGEIDYHTHRPVGHQLTPEEVDYLRRDVLIVAKAMHEIITNGMTKLTVASDSMAEYKRLIGDKMFSILFPVLSDFMDAEIRRALRGGWTYCDPRFKSAITRSGVVLDVNSLYPFIMASKPIPYGVPEFIEGQVLPTERRPLTIFSVTFTAKIKPDHVPCIQIKGSSIFGGTEYLNEIDEPVTLTVTNVDWDLYNDHYDIDVQAYGGGWAFTAAIGMFDAYINKWSAIKAAETGGKKEIAKLHLNSLYGKFGSNPNVASKYPTLHNGAVKLVRGQDETRPPIYTAAAVFITSRARNLTIRAAQENYATFAYADTDSLHLLQDEVPESIEVHPTKLGAWKKEYHFDSALYIRPKAYLEKRRERACEHDTGDNECGEHCKYTTHIAGLPVAVASKLVFDDIKHGRILKGKMQPKAVPGGIVLKDIDFEIKL